MGNETIYDPSKRRLQRTLIIVFELIANTPPYSALLTNLSGTTMVETSNFLNECPCERQSSKFFFSLICSEIVNSPSPNGKKSFRSMNRNNRPSVHSMLAGSRGTASNGPFHWPMYRPLMQDPNKINVSCQNEACSRAMTKRQSMSDKWVLVQADFPDHSNKFFAEPSH